MKILPKWLFVVVILAGLTLPAMSHATNGMLLIGQGAKARGMGGVAIALPQDAISGAANPANLTEVGSRLDLGGDVFVPRAHSQLGGIGYNSSASLFAMPVMGAAYKFNRNMSVGFSAVPAGGGGSRYNLNLYNAQTGASIDKTLGVNLMIMHMNPTIAYRINKNNSVGLSGVLAIQTFRAYGLDFFSNFTQTGLFTDKLSNNGNDWSYGAGLKLGWLGTFFKDRLALGLSYQSRIYMTKFDKYEDLFAESGSMDYPESFGGGIALKITPDLTVAADVTRTLYSNVNAIGNHSATTTGSGFPVSQQVNALGLPQGLGFGWGDQTVYKIGATYDWNSSWTLRAGWNYGKSPINEKNGEVLFAIVAPATVQNHLTLGATYKTNKHIEWSFSYVHAFKYEQSGPTLIGNTGKISMYQNAFGVNFGYKL
jgi:long-chain fatty acid transport protein